MYFQLDKNLHICLAADHPLIDQYANQALADWIHTTGTVGPCGPHDIRFHLEMVEQLPLQPALAPVFAENGRWPDGVGDLTVYRQGDGYLLYFSKGGFVEAPHERDGVHVIRGYITADLLKYGRLYDLLFTSLSPFLRRQGYYLVHASAAADENGALLFIGPPGSGKTTTLLNLLMNGWRYLGNDTLLLQARPDGVYALPTPGGFAIRPASVEWLPALTPFLPPEIPAHTFYIPARKVVRSWAEAAPVKHIYFSTIVDEGTNQLTPFSPAMTLVHLMNHSLDRWDTASLPAHISLLEQLSRQASGFALKIAQQEQIADLIAA